jgi:hypothetical protein
VDADLRWQIHLVEIKEGKVNRILEERLAAGDYPENLREIMGDNAAKQAKRMLHQRGRINELSKIVHIGKGIDPRTDIPMSRTAYDIYENEHGYQDELRMLIEKAARTGQHLITGRHGQVAILAGGPEVCPGIAMFEAAVFK